MLSSTNQPLTTSSKSILSSSLPSITSSSKSPTQSSNANGPSASLFPGCQFRYGRDFVSSTTDYSQYDYITIWIDTISSNCPSSNSKNPDCTNFNPYYQGVMLQTTKSLNKIPVFYGYVIAFEARNLQGLQDCNVGTPSLCQYGSQFIRDNRARILERYNNQSYNIAQYLGTNYTTVFLIEPDFWYIFLFLISYYILI